MRACCCVRAVLGWLWSAHAQQTPIAPARSHSLSARGRGATRQLRPQIISRRSRGMRERATAHAVSREAALRASLLRARAVPRWLWSVHALWKATAPTGSHFFSARGTDATCQMQPSKMSRLSRGMRERANALTISQEEAQHASLLLRARRAGLVAVVPCTTNGHCTSRKPLSFGARPWCDVPAAASKN